MSGSKNSSTFSNIQFSICVQYRGKMVCLLEAITSNTIIITPNMILGGLEFYQESRFPFIFQVTMVFDIPSV